MYFHLLIPIIYFLNQRFQYFNILIFTFLVIDMKQGDILNMDLKDWRDGDVVFANSTCFDENLMSKIANLAGNLIIFTIISLLNLHISIY